MQVVNASGAVQTQYSYDAWGNFTSSYANPFTYRGYYFDSETGLYYLNSRYYDPGTGRFISSDAYVDTEQGVYSHNMFAYCNDDPVNNFDDEGKICATVALKVAGAVFNGVFAGITTIVNGGSLGEAALDLIVETSSSLIGFDKGLLKCAKIIVVAGYKCWREQEFDYLSLLDSIIDEFYLDLSPNFVFAAGMLNNAMHFADDVFDTNNNLNNNSNAKTTNARGNEKKTKEIPPQTAKPDNPTSLNPDEKKNTYNNVQYKSLGEYYWDWAVNAPMPHVEF